MHDHAKSDIPETLEIMPLVSVGPIRFGMTREDVQHALGIAGQAFQRAPAVAPSTIPQDRFRELGIFVEYRPPGICTSVEFGGPVSPTFQGEAFLGKPYRQVRDWFAKRDPTIKEDDSGLISHELGIGIYTSTAHTNPDGPVESVIVFEKGYYEDGE